MLGWGGRYLGWVCCFSCVVCGLGLGFVWKNALWFETSFSTLVHSANYLRCFWLYGWRNIWVGPCNCCRLSASLSRYYASSIFTFSEDVLIFRALPYSQGYTFTIHFSLMILNMHLVHDCNSVYIWMWEGAGGIHCNSSPPTSLKYRVIKKKLELCSSEKTKKNSNWLTFHQSFMCWYTTGPEEVQNPFPCTRK